tara:strand:- start:3417 stop:4202 length:786 start_codon:yes stop_codon:yes gene_type:complete
MKQQKLLINISELLSRFRVQVGILNTISMLDINIVAENFLIPILNEVYDCDFINANLFNKNYPAVDVVDKTKKIAIQITSTSTTKKVRETLEKILKNDFQNTYNKFFILVITSKQEKYNISVLRTATQGKFQFTNENVIDVDDLFRLIASLNLAKIENIERYLKNQYTDIETTNHILSKNIPPIINKIDGPQFKYLKSKLQTAYTARKEWYEKKAFFETNSPGISDLNQKFSIEKQISVCNEKIQVYENDIITITNQINNG